MSICLRLEQNDMKLTSGKGLDPIKFFKQQASEGVDVLGMSLDSIALAILMKLNYSTYNTLLVPSSVPPIMEIFDLNFKAMYRFCTRKAQDRTMIALRLCGPIKETYYMRYAASKDTLTLYPCTSEYYLSLIAKPKKR